MNTIKLGKSSPIIKSIKDQLKNNNDGFIIIEDLNSLEIALKFNHVINTFIYCDDLDYHPETKAIINNAADFALKSYTTSKSVFDTLAQKDNAIGFIALLDVKTNDLDLIKNKNFVVVCDKLEIPGNLGTIYRTMDSASAEAMILVDSITKFTNPKLVQAARGTNLIIPTAIMSYEQALKFLLDNGFQIFLGEPKLGLDYQSYDYKGKIAIVVGNERYGINPDWYNHENTKVFIPMEGNNNSLNVGVAASILIYEAYMKRKKN